MLSKNYLIQTTIVPYNMNNKISDFALETSKLALACKM